MSRSHSRSGITFANTREKKHNCSNVGGGQNSVSCTVCMYVETGDGIWDFNAKRSYSDTGSGINSSKTQNIWTFYYMEFLQVKQLSAINFDTLDPAVVDFMPLIDNTISEVTKTRKFRGIEVVDNTINILKNRDSLSKLLKSAIFV